MDWRFLAALLLHLQVSNVAALSCMPGLGSLYNMHEIPMGPGHGSLLMCPDEATDSFIDGDRILHVLCVNGLPSYVPGPDCIFSNVSHAKCNESSISKPSGMVTGLPVSGSTDSLAGVYYKCSSSNMTFLSGNRGTLTQCLDGSWTPIFDECVDECKIPKGCSDLVEIGVNKTGLYRVIPSGNPLSTSKLVWCEMHDTTDVGTGWTTVLRHFNGTKAIAYALQDYEEGVGDADKTWEDDSSYFLGLESFYLMNLNEDGSYRKIVLQFIMEDIAGHQYHATFGNLTFEYSTLMGTYHLMSAKSTYHGDAGEFPLLSNMGRNFTCMQHGGDGCWFGFDPDPRYVYTHLSAAKPFWGYKMLKYIHVRFRPEDLDAEDSCPPAYFKQSFWRFTLVDIPVSRLPGVSLTYECVGDIFFMGGETIETTVCLNSTTPGFSPYWNHSFPYPCKYTHPPGFIVSTTRDTSYIVYQETKFGIAEAEKNCSGSNATLAEISWSTFSSLNEFDYSYTTHVFRDGQIVPPLDMSQLSCNDSCQASKDKPCILVNSNHTYKASSCSEPHGFICKHPAHCPDNFTLHEGSCYEIIKADGDFISAVESCNADMAALVYPESLEVLDFLAKFLEDHVGTTNLPQDALIGLYKSSDGLWNGTIDYQPESALINLTDASSPWQALKALGNEKYELVGVPFTGGQTLYAICQYLGPIGCLQDPPDISMNMTYSGNATSYALNHEVNYTCDIGYFVNGTVPEREQTSKCLGQFGEWTTQLLECLPVEVCTSPLPKPPSELITNTTTWTSRLWTGSTLYTCPPNMSTADGLLEQTVNCTEQGGMFGFDPSVIEPCDVCTANLSIPLAITTWDSKPTWKIGELVSAECVPGHHASVSNKTLYANCTETGWVILGSCYPACTDPPPAPGLHMVMGEFLSDAFMSTVNYACSAHHYLPITPNSPVLRANVTISCQEILLVLMGGTPKYIWEPNISLSCSRMCFDDPPQPHGLIVSSWDSFNHSVGAEVTYACPAGLLFGDLAPSWLITCEENGNWTSIENPLYFNCRMPAPTPPPTPPFQATLIKSEDHFWVKSTVNYSCDHGQMSPLGVTYVILTCTTSRWTPPLDPEFVCLNICTSPPPGPMQGTLNNMTGYPFWDTVIEYWCLDGYLFPDYTTTRLTVCQEGQWTMSVLPEARADLPPPPSPPSPDVMVTKPPYVVGSVLHYTCPEGKLFPDGKQYTTVNRTSTGWTYLDPYYVCLNVCIEAPHKAYGNITSNYTGMSVWGSAVEYRCKGLFHGGGTTRLNYCLPGGKWSLFYLSYCMNVDPNAPQPPPTTAAPPKFPNSDVRTQAYNITTDAYMPSLEKFTENAGDESVQFILTDGPFGFGYAVDLTASNKECMKRSPYPEINKCPKDPANCPKGMSMGIWERTNISYDVFNTVHKLHEEPKRYVISTGGDELGHPGIAIYHQGLALIAIFSTGDQYWKLEVLGPIENTEWNNIGIRWIPKNGNEGGLEMYINARKVGQQHLSVESTPKAALDPVELLIGCHRDADDMEYRGYSDADFDEFAAWKRRLSDEDTVLYLGGFEGEVENLDPEEFGLMLGRTNLKDPKQAAIAMAMLSSMMGAELDQLNAPIDPNATAEATDTATDSGNSTEIPLSPRAQRLCSMVFAVSKVFTSGVKDDLTRDEMQGYMEIVGAASQMLDESIAEVWEELEDSECSGANDFRKDLETYMKSLVTSFKLDKDSPPMNYTKITDNVVATVQKFNSKNCNSIKNKFITPNFTESREMRNLRVELNFPLDKMEVNKAVYCDPGCKDHTISLFSFYYLSFAEVGPKKINEEAMNEKVMNKIDGKVMSIDIISEPPKKPKPPKPSDPKCHSVAKNLEKHPIVTRLEHEVKIASLRSLSFHQDEISSLISKRYCVWWNFDVGETGSWDPEGCSLLATNELYTKCACSQLGIFAIMSEYVEERELPPEAYWVTMIKYIGCIISALCIIFYILVVALAGDLKDHFHVSGLCLAGCVLLGSIFLLVSDLESVRDGRHACTAMGSLIHGFYLAAAAFTAMVGHAGFKAVTGGIIGGRMTPYMMISWGVTLISIGFSVLFFLHELGTDPRCFISWFDEIKYIFFLPLMMCVSVAVFFVVVIFFNVRHAKKIYNTSMSIFGSFITGSTVVILYFSITWIFGFFAYIRWMEAYALYPLFHIMNSFMGVVILLGLGLSSSKFRGVLAGQAKKRREMMQNFNPRNKAKKLDNKTSPPPPSRSSQPPPPVPTELGGNK